MPSKIGSGVRILRDLLSRLWSYWTRWHIPVIANPKVIAPVLGISYIVGGLTALWVSTRAPETGQWLLPKQVLSSTGVAFGVLVLAARWTWPPWTVHLLVGTGPMLIGTGLWIVRGESDGPPLAALLTLVTLFSFFFFAWPVAVCYEAIVQLVLVASVRCWGLPLELGVVLSVVNVLSAALTGQLVRLAGEAEADGVTGVPDRQSFERVASRAVERAGAGAPLAIALIRVDMNVDAATDDRRRYDLEDQRMAAAARRWVRLVPPNHVLARYSGDEFGLVMPGWCAAEAVDLVDILRSALPATLGCTAGIAEWESTDTRLSLALRAGGAIPDTEPGEQRTFVVRTAADRQDLETALADGEFVVYYQPIVDLVSEQVVGAEALLRRRHPHRGLVMPAEFIPTAERTGFICELGHWALRTACATAAGWPQVAGGPLTLTVNVAGQELHQPDYVEGVVRVLATTGLPPGQLILEVTESSVLADADSAVDALRRLRKLGIRIAIDDFGTGYSSLGRLERLPVDVLKIDRAFVGAIKPGTRSAPIVSAVTALAAALGLTAVAEGIEHPYQAAAVARHGCERAQGWLYGRPAPELVLCPAVRPPLPVQH
jgi:EAL domain-containing protein (putative c-di-GMP-specific phosphodiesterase class I)/GGDEF domain-containing protein